MSEPAEAAAVARKLLELISHPLHELSTSSRGAVVSSLCFSWVTLFYAGVFRCGSSVAHRLLTSHSKQGISNPGMEAKAEETLKPSEAGLREGTPTDIPISVESVTRPEPAVLVCQQCVVPTETESEHLAWTGG